jgi:DNA helicase-2/ATP-dependent DNA helicase PcrA
MKTIILGPPGTGKTTTLLNLVDEFIKKGVRPKEIGYFSFTKKAAIEAATRAAEKFGLSPEHDLTYFRTLHSFAFKLLGITKDKMMGKEDYREFGLRCNIPIKTASYSEDDGVFNSDNEYLTIINTARVKRMDLLECYDLRRNLLDIERDTLFLLDQELKKYKAEKGLKDFTDLLEEFIEKDISPKFKVLFIDEAQDLSHLQWEMVRSIWKKSEKTYIAGDDDQAIFRWAGADIDHFIALKNEVDEIQTLKQSYRIPGGTIHELSQKIISRVKNRYEKDYKPRQETGLLKYYTDVTQVDMSKGEWLILASAKHFLDDVKELCELQGWYYQYKGMNSISLELLLALNNWEDFRNSKEFNYLQIKNMYRYLGSNVAPGYRDAKTLKAEEKYTIKDCMQNHGLLNNKVWYESFEGVDTITENYIRNMRANGEKINKIPRILMSTIHGAKGGEREKVLVLLDLTTAAIKQGDEEPDDLHRLFYTAFTRAKQELHIVDPRDFNKAYII